MYRKIILVIVSAVLILAFSRSIAAKEVLPGRVELEDGSVIVGRIEEPSTILYVETKYGKMKVQVEDIVSIVGDEISLKNGIILKGIVEIRQVIVRPIWCERLEIKGEYVNSIWFLAEIEIPSMPPTAPVSIKPDDSTWSFQNPLILVYLTSRGQVVGAEKRLWGTLIKIINIGGTRMQIWGHPSLISIEEKDIQRLMDSHSIFLIHPKSLKQLQELEDEHPELLPCSYSELKCYPCPFLYFSRNAETDRVRGVIIANEVTPSLAKLLTEDVLPLDIPVLLEYENGQLKKK